MFTWVCQRCGSEVDVAQTNCPTCSAKEKADAEFGSARGAAPGEFELPIAVQSAEPEAAGPEPAPREPSVAHSLPEPVFAAPPPPVARPLPVREQERPSGPAPLGPEPSVFSLQPSHLLVFLFALMASVAVAVFLSRPELIAEWRDKLTAPATADGTAPVALPAPGGIEAAGLRAWRDEKAQLRVRATLVNHQMSPTSELEYEVLLFARADDDKGRPLGSFLVKFDEPLAGRSAREVEAELIAPDGLAEFPDWSDLVGRVRRPQPPAEESPSETAEQ